MQSELQKRLFADDSQNDFEVQGPIQAISTVGVQSVASVSASMLNEPAGKRPKVEDLTALLLGLQQSMHDQSLGIVSAIRTATEAGQACVLIAERMQQGFASFAAAPAAAVVAPSTPSVAVINQSPSPASPSPPRGKLPDEFEKYIVKSVGAFEKQVLKFVRSKDMITLEEEQFLTMQDHSGGLRYPSGVRPFKSQEERGDLDEPWSESLQAELVFNVRVPMGSSRREAMQLVHHAASLFHKKVDLEGRKEHVESLRSAVTRRAFIETCTAWTPNPVSTLDLDEPLRQRQCVDDLAVHRIETAYAKIVDIVRDRKSQQVKQRLEEESKKRESEANLLKHKPECLLVDLIDQRVSAKVSEAYGDDMAVEGGVPVGDQVASFVRSIQKNGVSPGVGLGHNKQSNKKGKNPKQTDVAAVQARSPSQVKRQSKGVEKAKEKAKQKTKESN